jgi:alanine racemase
MSRAARATISLSALKHNLQRARDIAAGSKVIAVVKANGYGHGMNRVAKALNSADGFGVASFEEALQLRDAGIKKPIVLLEGFFEASELTRIQMHKFDTVVHHVSQIEILEEHARHVGQSINVWLKVDTGMHRIGFPIDKVDEVWQQLNANQIVGDICLMTHLANADDKKDKTTSVQIQQCNKISKQLDIPSTIANSAGILAWPESHKDIVRPGIMLYGVSPFIKGRGSDENLKPVMSLVTKLIATNNFKKGDKIGYGGEWKCPEDMRIGVAAIGYGDGYPRHAKSLTPVLVNGKRASLLGRVSMDMICVDLREDPKAKVGDPVVLWGEGLPVEEVAECASTIAYELLCGVAQRVEFIES